MQTSKPYSVAPKSGNFKVSREEWIAAARQQLIENGIEFVKIDALSRNLGVTRGGFYWFFGNRQSLLDALLLDWEHSNNRAFIQAAKGTQDLGFERLNKLASLWIDETDFSPAYDAAVRRWGAVDQAVRAVLERVDNDRVSLIASMFREMGHEEEEAFVRARITYFHQVGYYTLGVKETAEERRLLLPIYQKVLAF